MVLFSITIKDGDLECKEHMSTLIEKKKKDKDINKSRILYRP